MEACPGYLELCFCVFRGELPEQIGQGNEFFIVFTFFLPALLGVDCKSSERRGNADEMDQMLYHFQTIRFTSQ